MKTPILSTLVVLSLASGAALADRGGQGAFMRFFDANQDGTVTVEEFTQAAGQRFARMDGNGDGKLTADEFQAYDAERQKERQQSRFKRMDSDQNGQVSKEEYLAYEAQKAERRFGKLDKDANGVLEAGEYSHCDRGRREHGKNSLFTRLDTNQDGTVTAEESLQAWKAWFDRMDMDKDGTVTVEEVQEYRTAKKAE